MSEADTMERGICRLSSVPLRAESSDKSEMVSQMLFGEHYSVLEYREDRKWIRVKIEFDGYVGWIDATQHTQISEDYFWQINSSDYKICTDLTSTLLYKKNALQVLMGSILPISTHELFKIEEQLAFNGDSKGLNQKRDVEFLKQIAGKYLNTPYLWGGRSPFGIDCSGFTQQVFRICGYTLKRDAYQQAEQGTEVPALSQAQPGDLAFFRSNEGRISHVGIIWDQKTIIHASGCVRLDEITDEGIVHTETRQLTHQLSGLKKVLND